ncbi:transcriptional regulator [Pedobacter sp. GR22-6]|uniref:transcriptional regulator n=1 Tax=Pedobacter sp. GR22-6 TaxID=3127957 RepID=UPI00307EE24E
MEKITIATDIKVFCVDAESFPEGILKAHQKLHALVPFSEERKYFGVSRMENGGIIYKAAAEELQPGELAKHDLAPLILPSGEYQCILIRDFMKNIEAIGAAFEELTQLPDIDPQGYCLEWYVSDKDVRCMVRVV